MAKKKQANKKKPAAPDRDDLLKALGPEARAKHEQLDYQSSHDEQPAWYLIVVSDSGPTEVLMYTNIENMQKQLVKLTKSTVESYHVYMFFGVQAFLSQTTESGLRYLITPGKDHPLPIFEDRVELEIDPHGTLGPEDIDIEKSLDEDDDEEEYDYEEDEEEVVVGNELDSAEAADRDEQLRKFTPPGEDIPEESDDEDEELAEDEEWEDEEEEEGEEEKTES